MKYSLGLDIGITSVGWAVINEDKKRIEDLGVRIFEIPENPKNGESLAKPRRDKRSARRRLKRRRQRLNFLKEFFVAKELLTRQQIAELFQYDSVHTHKDPYLARIEAISKKVPNDELFIALYHIAKRRGYKSNRKKVEEKDGESGKVLQAIHENQPLLAQYDGSVAKTLACDKKFAEHKRNKAESYTNSFIRADFDNEIRTILKTQGWSEEWITELLDSNPVTTQKSGLFYQRPFMTDELINKMRGQCQFEKDESRAPKASYSFEMFRLVSNLVNLTYNEGERLTAGEIDTCVLAAKKTASLKYATIRKALGYDKNPEFKFDYIRGKQKEDIKETEKNDFGGLKFYHAVKKALKDLPSEWQQIENNTKLFDQIGEALTCNKDDAALEVALKRLGLRQSVIDQLMKLNFSGFCHLSIVALNKITPELVQGLTYDKAVESVYPGEFSEKISGNKNELPPLTEAEQNQLTNPVVKRAISQVRKVVNAIIRKYGAPYQIKIECTNELAKSFKDRKAIEKQQKENQENNEKIKTKLEELGYTSPTGQQIIKYKLREEQSGKCVYCGAPLDVEIFGDNKLAEVDHIIPFSVCGNDSFNNKVLSCAKCNQEKKNQTPFQAWGSDTARWQGITSRAVGLNIKPQKRARLLAEKAPKEDWNSRALNDTRYAMRFMSQYIKRNLKFSDDSKGKQRVLLPTGFITSYSRKILGLSKNREENNCHHAVDACIVATLSQDQIQKFALWNKYKELGAHWHTEITYDEDGASHTVSKKEYEAVKTDLEPWPNFAKEVRIRSGMSYDTGKIEKLSDFRDKFRDFESYDVEFINNIHPLFVSRMPKRSAKGSAHQDTIRSPKATDDNRRLNRKKLKEVELKDLENSVVKETDRALYEQLVQLIADKGEHAFDEPVWKNDKKFDKNGKPISPVRTIKVYDKNPMSSGILINNGTQYVNNGDTVCLNMYRRKSHNGEYKLYAAPVYVHSLHKTKLPILPTPKGGNKLEKADLETIREGDGTIYATSENGFELVTQVYPNDYIRITYPKDIAKEGYYVKYNISNGALSLLPHNQSQKDSFLVITLGSAINIQKLDISVLGDNYRFE